MVTLPGMVRLLEALVEMVEMVGSQSCPGLLALLISELRCGGGLLVDRIGAPSNTHQAIVFSGRPVGVHDGDRWDIPTLESDRLLALSRREPLEPRTVFV